MGLLHPQWRKFSFFFQKGNVGGKENCLQFLACNDVVFGECRNVLYLCVCEVKVLDEFKDDKESIQLIPDSITMTGWWFQPP